MKKVANCLWFHTACATRGLLLELPVLRFSGRSHQMGTHEGGHVQSLATDLQHREETPTRKHCTKPPLHCTSRSLAQL